MTRTTSTPLTDNKMDFLAIPLAEMRSNADDAAADAHQYQK